MKFTCRSDATRQLIIEKAATLFNMKGFAATSLSDLCKVTQLTKGSIYGNFKNKEDVAMAVFEYNLSRKTNAIKQKVHEAGNYGDKLLAFAYSFADIDHRSSIAGGCPLLNAGIEADDTNADLRKKVAAGLLNWKNEMVRII
ncbi:MAG TPA: TetR/AcrR family transcriptional regulator, partial [Waddliaceae bacterium]